MSAIEPNSVAAATDAALKASDSGTDIGTIIGSSSGVAALMYLFLKSKLDSLSGLWRWKDGFVKEYNENRLKDAKEYATRADLERAIEKLENYMKDRFDRLEKKLDDSGGRNQ